MPEAPPLRGLFYKVERGAPPIGATGRGNLTPHRAAVRKLSPGHTVLLPLVPNFGAVYLAVVKERAANPGYRYITRKTGDALRVWCVAASPAVQS